MDEKDKFNISFSQYSTYKNCQHKWYLRYIAKLPGEDSEELLFGSSVHAVIEELLTNKLFSRLYKVNPEKTIKDLFKSALMEELKKVNDVDFLKKFSENNLASIFMFQAEKLILELDFFNRFKNWKVEEVEHKLDGFKIGEDENCEINFKGFIDLVLKDKEKDSYLILDWKTSGKKWDIVKKVEDNKNFYSQLCLYKYFYAKKKELDPNNIQTQFYNLPRNTPKEQSNYPKTITVEEMEEFLKDFTETCFTMYYHKKKLADYTKIKMISKKNFCYRCKYNTPELCNDIDEFQLLPPDFVS